MARRPGDAPRKWWQTPAATVLALIGASAAVYGALALWWVINR